MSIRWLFALMVIGSVCRGNQGQADLITFSSDWPPRRVTAAEAAGGAPADGRVFQFRVTTDGDILSINTLQLTLGSGVQLYNHPFGGLEEAKPPLTTLVDLFPALGADSWINTPGQTVLLGPKLPGDGFSTTYGDLSNDGPQQDFVFAQLTLSPAIETVSFGFTGSVSIVGSGGRTVYSQPFSYFGNLEPFPPEVPEPASAALLAASFVGFNLARRRKSAFLNGPSP